MYVNVIITGTVVIVVVDVVVVVIVINIRKIIVMRFSDRNFFIDKRFN
jgi:hypothetical protein